MALDRRVDTLVQIEGWYEGGGRGEVVVEAKRVGNSGMARCGGIKGWKVVEGLGGGIWHGDEEDKKRLEVEEI